MKKWLAARRNKRLRKSRDNGYAYAANQLLIYCTDPSEMARLHAEANGDLSVGDEEDAFDRGMQNALGDWFAQQNRVYRSGREDGAAEVVKHGALSHEYHLRVDTHL